MVIKFHISWTFCIGSHEFLVSWGPLGFGVPRQHALQAHANALNVLNRTPTLLPQEIQAYETIRVDVRVDGNRSWGVCRMDKCDFWWFYGIGLAKAELESEDLAHV